jgi:hypothetical protein
MTPQAAAMEAMMPSPDHRPAAPVSPSRTLAGIIACLGALADEAQAIGDTSAADVLLQAMQKLQNRHNFH